MQRPAHLDYATARRLLAGDAREFRALFDSYFPRLYRFALARLRGDSDAANEVVQQTLCKAIERLHTYRGEAALYTWFCQICRNVMVDRHRALGREPAALALPEDAPAVRAALDSLQAPPSQEPEFGAWQRDVQRLVQVALDSLPEHYGEVLEWKYVDGQSVSTIALRLQLSVKATESVLTRARAAARDALLALAGTRAALGPPETFGRGGE